MIIIITGQPGNGKTLLAMHEMRREYERNTEAVKAGKEQPRRFFSNVEGATTEENPNAFPWVERMPDHNDWTKLPDGSFVQLDEAHSDGQTPGLERYGRLFPSTGKPGESDDMRIRALSTHRKRGIDVQLITQWPSKIHHQVRTLAGSHVHVSRAFGMERAGVLKWTRVQADPYDEDQRDKAEEEIWAFPKDLYQRYHSATMHSAAHKFRMPPAVWKGLSMLVVTGLLAWAFLSWIQGKADASAEKGKGGGPTQGQAGEAAAASAPPADVKPILNPGTGRYAALAAPPLPRIAGYIDSPRGCRIWSIEGEQLDISTRDCRDLVAKGLPVSFVADRRSESRREDEKREPPSVTSALTGAGSQAFGTMPGYGAMGVGAAHGDAVGSSP